MIFANAVFQWLPEHPAILLRLMDCLAPGGVLAVQMPDNLMRAVACADARDGRGDAVLPPSSPSAARAPLPPVGSYYDLLCGRSARLDIWHTIYNHPLADAAAIVEWVKSTGLKPFLDPLDEDERRAVPRGLSGADRRGLSRAAATARCCCGFRGCSSWRRRGSVGVAKGDGSSQY